MITIINITPEESRRLLQCGFASRFFTVIGTGEKLDDYAYRALKRVDDRRDLAVKSLLWLSAAIAVMGLPSLVCGVSSLFTVGFFGLIFAVLWALSLDLQTSSGAATLARTSSRTKAQVVDDVAASRISLIGRVDPEEADYVLRVIGR